MKPLRPKARYLSALYPWTEEQRAARAKALSSPDRWYAWGKESGGCGHRHIAESTARLCFGMTRTEVRKWHDGT